MGYKFTRGGRMWIPNIGWEGREVRPEAEKKIVTLVFLSQIGLWNSF